MSQKSSTNRSGRNEPTGVALGARPGRALLDASRRARLVAAVTRIARIAILILWAPLMTAGALACLLVQGVQVGYAIMADWIERIEP